LFDNLAIEFRENDFCLEKQYPFLYYPGMKNEKTKFIFYTDLHLTAKRPIHRVDDFTASLLIKLKEVYDVAVQEQADFVIFGGDFFNNHRIFSYEIILTASDIISKSGLPTYAVIGQHDLIGHNKETYKTSTLSFMEHFCTNFNTLCQPTKIKNVMLYPCHWFDNVRELVKNKPDSSCCSVMVCHQTITKDTAPYDTILTSELVGDYDLILSGDVHGGYPAHKIGKTLFSNSGSIARRAINETHDPRVLVVEVGKNLSVKEVKLKNVIPANDAFGTSILESTRVAAEDVDIERFIEGILELEQSAVDIFDLVQKIAIAKGIKQEVIDYVLSKRK
jgi:DNA repair exonuclease SbcCD nuclease subunit